MKKPIVIGICLMAIVLASAQSPFEPQLAIPVHFNELAKATGNGTKTIPNVSLSGIALLFLDTVSTADELILTGRHEPVIWHDYVGKSTKVTFIIPDTQMIGRLELVYFDSKCSAAVWRHDRLTNEMVHARGNLMHSANGYSLHFTVDDKTKNGISDVIDRLNVFLMRLHTLEMRRAAIKPWFDMDSLNVIVGADSQFNTDFELFWFDRSLRSRLYNMASNAFSKLILFKNNSDSVQDSVMGKYKIVHRAAPFDSGILGVQGTVIITLRPGDCDRYVFLQHDKSYHLTLDYSFFRGHSGPGELSINRFGLRNLDNGDFVEMDIYDMVNSGFPVMYVDLIRGVVMEEGGPWDISNVIHVIEDVLGSVRLPYE